MFTKRRAAITATFAALFVCGLLLTAFGGSPSPRYVHERVIVLGESGHVIQGHVGDIMDVLLGDVVSAQTTWRFTQTGTSVRVTPVFAASMPDVSPPAGGSGMPDTGPPPSDSGGRQTASAGGGGRVRRDGHHDGSPTVTPSFEGPVQMVRLTLVATGVTTVRGWRVPIGGAIPQSVPGLRLHRARQALTAPAEEARPRREVAGSTRGPLPLPPKRPTVR